MDNSKCSNYLKLSIQMSNVMDVQYHPYLELDINAPNVHNSIYVRNVNKKLIILISY